MISIDKQPKSLHLKTERSRAEKNPNLAFFKEISIIGGKKLLGLRHDCQNLKTFFENTLFFLFFFIQIIFSTYFRSLL